MPNMDHLLRKPAGKGLKPAVLPITQYAGMIAKYEYGESNFLRDGKKVPQVKFKLKITEWPDTVDADQRVQTMPDGTTKPIDLSKFQLTKDFSLLDDDLHSLDAFLRSLGLTPELDAGQTYADVIPMAQSKSVLISVTQYADKETGEVKGNNVGKVIGAE